MFPPDIEALAAEVIARARAAGVTLATAESCTGGLVAGALTQVAGSSAAFDRGVVTYSNAAKTALLGVEAALIDARGAVSQPVAQDMADGLLRISGAALGVSVTGIAGPGGGSPDKPVGLVWFGLAAAGRETVTVEKRFGDLGREAVRAEAVRTALGLLCDALP